MRIVGWWGLYQSAFTTKEMREILKMPMPIYMLKKDVDESMNEASLTEGKEGYHIQSRAIEWRT